MPLVAVTYVQCELIYSIQFLLQCSFPNGRGLADLRLPEAAKDKATHAQQFTCSTEVQKMCSVLSALLVAGADSLKLELLAV